MVEEECKTICETEMMELVESSDGDYQIYIWSRGIMVTLDKDELREIKQLLK